MHFFDISTSKSGPLLWCFVHFYLEMCFGATMACTFSTSQLPKVVRSSGVLSIFTWKCASRHNGVQFFISRLASWLRTRRFSEPTFRPPRPTNHWKNTVNRDFPTFSRICIFFLLDLFSSELSLLSASSLLCFSSVHIVGSLASKLPSMKMAPRNTVLITGVLLKIHVEKWTSTSKERLFSSILPSRPVQDLKGNNQHFRWLILRREILPFPDRPSLFRCSGELLTHVGGVWW